MADITAGMQDADIVYGGLKMVTDHRTKRKIRLWRGGKIHRYAFQIGWVPPHPTSYMRRAVEEKVHDLCYVTTADYDYILRALALNDFRVLYLPRLIADFQMGG